MSSSSQINHFIKLYLPRIFSSGLFYLGFCIYLLAYTFSQYLYLHGDNLYIKIIYFSFFLFSTVPPYYLILIVRERDFEDAPGDFHSINWGLVFYLLKMILFFAPLLVVSLGLFVMPFLGDVLAQNPGMEPYQAMDLAYKSIPYFVWLGAFPVYIFAMSMLTFGFAHILVTGNSKKSLRMSVGLPLKYLGAGLFINSAISIPYLTGLLQGKINFIYYISLDLSANFISYSFSILGPIALAAFLRKNNYKP